MTYPEIRVHIILEVNNLASVCFFGVEGIRIEKWNGLVTPPGITLTPLSYKRSEMVFTNLIEPKRRLRYAKMGLSVLL